MERLLDDISFDATNLAWQHCGDHRRTAYVDLRLERTECNDEDLSRYIL
jgi:ATP-dependent protease HslVU (ClpYQ) ATPase subunit